ANSVRTLSADMARKANQERQQAREKAEQELQSNNPELWQDYNQLSEDKKQLVLRETSKDYRTADEQAQSWGIGGGKSRALNAVTSAVTGILGGQTNLQAATNALAPYAAELIGKQFGHGDNQNQAAQLVAHALLGAISASVNGGNAAAGAVGASAAELAAQYLIKQLPKDQYPEAIDPRTGEIDPNRLPESVKANIRDLSSAVATVSGGLTGGSLVNAQIAGVVGQNAVENNQLGINHQQSDQKAIKAFHQKVKNELGNKFELKGTGKLNLLGYEIMELVPIGGNTVSNLTPAEINFYNMLNSVIKDPTGTAQMILVYDDDQVSGGSWKYNRFDVADMEKLDKNHITLSGNMLIAHELNEQLEKDKLGLKSGEGKDDKKFEVSHEHAIDHDIKLLPQHIEMVTENLIINGKKYAKIYRDKNTGNLIGVNPSTRYTENGRELDRFEPKQDIIKPNNKNGSFTVYSPNNPHKPLIWEF
ncbi:VENN motif pre-toxin domain-containing protein, partial [Snodgrassella communis]|uniref:VENN motif pre-toxin domain-containing protein n=1 Tax=Snodgrassella communis TaxID=2946699 RepID=UPI001EF4E063